MPRRSSRLNVPAVEIPISKKRKFTSICPEPSVIITSISNPSDELALKSAQVDTKLITVLQREEKAAEIIERWEIKQAEDTLALLEDHFTCSL